MHAVKLDCYRAAVAQLHHPLNFYVTSFNTIVYHATSVWLLCSIYKNACFKPYSTESLGATNQIQRPQFQHNVQPFLHIESLQSTIAI